MTDQPATGALPVPPARIVCPLAACGWWCTPTSPTPPAIFQPDSVSMAIRYAVHQDETLLRTHLETHTVEEWAAELLRLHTALDRARESSTFAGFRLETTDQVPPGAVLVLPPQVPAADRDPDVEHVDGRPVPGMVVIRVGEPR